MAQNLPHLLQRPAIPPNRWSRKTLRSYNIRLVARTREQFFPNMAFPVPDPPQQAIANFLADAENVGGDQTAILIRFLNSAMALQGGDESDVDRYIFGLLQALDYEIGGPAIKPKHTLRFTIGNNDNRKAIPNLALLGQNRIQLLVECKTRRNAKNVAPQVIASAIAAFQNRTDLAVNEMTFLCLGMRGTCPTYFRIVVNLHLSNSVGTGAWPGYNAPTEVEVYKPDIPLHVGMLGIEHRRLVCQDLHALRNILPPDV